MGSRRSFGGLRPRPVTRPSRGHGRTGVSLAIGFCNGRSWAGRPVPLGVALLLLTAACDGEPGRADPVERAAVPPVSARDDAGRSVALPHPARRVVSLLPSATATIVALGAADLLAARTDHDLGLEVSHLPSVGGGLTPSMEALASVRPDLVIAWEEAGGTRLRPRLEELGIPVFAVQTRDTAAVFANIERLGTLLGRDSAAAALGSRLRSELDDVRRSVAGRDTPSVLYVVSRDPPMVVGTGLFISELIEVAGGRTAFPEIRYSPQLSLEEIVRRRPELVLLPVSGDSAAAVERLRTGTGWRELLADGRVRLRTVDADVLHRPGPSIAESARVLRDAIHPGAAAAGAAPQ
jgi:ABC-type Fe3+-hydroxamate transport system substrate-binding protein